MDVYKMWGSVADGVARAIRNGYVSESVAYKAALSRQGASIEHLSEDAARDASVMLTHEKIRANARITTATRNIIRGGGISR